MQGVQEQLEQALRDRAGVVALRTHPELAWALRSAKQRGEVVAVWPGIYAATVDATDFRVRVLALITADPDAILIGPSAEVALGWRVAEANEVITATSHRLQTQQRGYRLVRRRIAPDDVATWSDGDVPAADRVAVRITAPAVTAVDLARERGSDAVDNALRQGVTLTDLNSVLDRYRLPGNAELRRILRDSRDEPWSAAERVAQRALRDHGVEGWLANRAVARTATRFAYPDVAFDDLLLAIEIDGYEHHGGLAAFLSDRERDLDLTLLGWQVVRVAAGWVLQHADEFAAAVQAIVAIRATLLRAAPA